MELNKSQKKILISSVILAILICIYVFRWHTLAQKSDGARVMKWEKDIISGEIIFKEYSRNHINTKRLDNDTDFGIIYMITVITTTLYLVREIVKYKGVPK